MDAETGFWLAIAPHCGAPRAFAPMLRAGVRREALASGQEHVHVKEWHLDIDPRELRWESYVKAGYYGVLERFFAGASAVNG